MRGLSDSHTSGKKQHITRWVAVVLYDGHDSCPLQNTQFSKASIYG